MAQQHTGRGTLALQRTTSGTAGDSQLLSFLDGCALPSAGALLDSSGIAPAVSAWDGVPPGADGGTSSRSALALSDDGDSGPGATTVREASPRADAGTAAGGVAPLRCLDASHAACCTRCAEAPPEGREEAFELRGTDGKKNGEKRLRSLLARTPEWLSATERAAAARACDEDGGGRHARLAGALRERKCVAMRKGDLLHLCRLWRYRSDIWGRRRDWRNAREAAADAAAAAPAQPAQPAQHAQQLQLPLGLGGPSLAAHGNGGDLVATADGSRAMADLRALAQRSVLMFADDSGIERLRGAFAAAPAAALPAIRSAVTHKILMKHVGTARTQQLVALLQTQHAAVQSALLLTPADERAQPTWRVLAARGEEPLEEMLKHFKKLCGSALGSCTSSPFRLDSFTSNPAVLSAAEAAAALAAANGVAAQHSLVLRQDAAPTGEAEQSIVCSVDPKWTVTFETTLEMLTTMESIVCQLKLSSYETYLKGIASVAGVLLGHTSTVLASMQRQLQVMIAAWPDIAAAAMGVGEAS